LRCAPEGLVHKAANVPELSRVSEGAVVNIPCAIL